MKLSLYTGVRDGLFYDFHVEAMLRHHLPLADEIIVNEGYSSDGTYEAISRINPKIQVHRFEWDRSDPSAWHRQFKNQARQLCTGDWCILLDCDEFIADWEFVRLRTFLTTAAKTIVPVRFVHFYANYRVYMARLPKIVPDTGLRIHRNLRLDRLSAVQFGCIGVAAAAKAGATVRTSICAATKTISHLSPMRHLPSTISGACAIRRGCGRSGVRRRNSTTPQTQDGIGRRRFFSTSSHIGGTMPTVSRIWRFTAARTFRPFVMIPKNSRGMDSKC